MLYVNKLSLELIHNKMYFKVDHMFEFILFGNTNIKPSKVKEFILYIYVNTHTHTHTHIYMHRECVRSNEEVLYYSVSLIIEINNTE